MLISIDWIKDFVSLPDDLDEKALRDRFTMCCAEVEKVVSTGEVFQDIRVAEILSFKKHPHADKLHLVEFALREEGEEKREVVCGASGLRKGAKVPYAPVGIQLPNGMRLESKVIRNVLSEGMLCSREELGLDFSSGERERGLMELPDDTPVGENLADVLKIPRDVILDVDNKSLTHRPDLWGHLGLAREFAAIFEHPLKNPFGPKWEAKLKEAIPEGDPSPIDLRMQMEPASAGLAYLGLSIDGITLGESSDTIKHRLATVGLRPINSIVDISNYVMVELGIPLHIFDRDKISQGQIIVKTLDKEELFTTLDGQARHLIPGDTVIADGEKTLVLAGIMGGLESGVSETTRNIFIEVANWKAASIRQTSTRLGLRTDSSQRYEKSLDSQLLERTLLRTMQLVMELCPQAKVRGGIQSQWTERPSRPPYYVERVIETSPSKIQKVLGHEVPKFRIKEIFTSLGFQVHQDQGRWSVKVPSFRGTKDIKGEEDLIEEVGRLIGYDKITPRSPALSIKPVKLNGGQTLHRKIREFCQYQARSFEVMTYPLVGEKLLNRAAWPDKGQTLRLINALSNDADRMRPSLVPGLLQAVALNSKHWERFHLFELGRIYHKGEGKTFARESSHLAMAFFDQSSTPFLELSGLLERLLATCGFPGKLLDRSGPNPVVDETWPGRHPVEYLSLSLTGRRPGGAIFSVHPYLLRSFKIKGHLSLALVDLTDIEAKVNVNVKKYRPLPKFPGSTFDWTVVVPKDVGIQEVLASLEGIGVYMKELTGVKVVDVFPLNDRQKSITLRASFLHPEKTLGGKFLNSAKDQLIALTEKAGFSLKA